MKRKCLFLLLIAALLTGSLAGCGLFIDRTYIDVRPHRVETAPPLDTEDYIIIATQAELELAIWGMVQSRQESGLFRLLYLGTDGVEAVEAAVREMRERPLTAYAVSMFEQRILSEWQGVTELELVISFQKSAAQIDGVRTVNSDTSAMALLEQMLRGGETYLAILAPAHIANHDFLERSLRDYYYSQALEVVVWPEMDFNLYTTGTGNRRIASVSLDFGFDQRTLAQMRGDLRRAATELIRELPEGLTPPQEVIWLANMLANRVVAPPVSDEYAEDDNPEVLCGRTCDTAYGALVTGQATAEGIAMAFQALMELLGLDAQFVRGELDGAAHAWNILALDGYYFHMDVSMLRELGPEYALFVPDEVMMFQNGYSWNAVLFPRADSGWRYWDFGG